MSEESFISKRDLVKFGGGALLVGAITLGLIKVQEAQDEKKEQEMFANARVTAIETVRKMAINEPTMLVRDTLDLNVRNENGKQEIHFINGTYNAQDDIALSHYYRDITGRDFGKKVADEMNKQSVNADYHEIRHAMNARIINHCHSPLAPDIFAADEISARVAESLASMAAMPALKAGEMSPHISYTISTEYDLRLVADLAFEWAVKSLSIIPEYQDKYIDLTLDMAGTELKRPTIDRDAVINEMMTFDINGRPENMLKHASQEIQIAVRNYLANSIPR